jgi:hypothetical protein
LPWKKKERVDSRIEKPIRIEIAPLIICPREGAVTPNVTACLIKLIKSERANTSLLSR